MWRRRAQCPPPEALCAAAAMRVEGVVSTKPRYYYHYYHYYHYYQYDYYY